MIVAVEHLNFIKCTFLMLFLAIGGLAYAKGTMFSSRY